MPGKWCGSGRAEKVLTGGYDALCQLTFAGFDSLQALSPTPCRPFDAQRNGLTLGEGAAMLTLETLAGAKKREAEILGEIIGYGAATDTHHLTQPHPEGKAALAAMNAACATRASRRSKLIMSTRTARPRRKMTRPKPPPSTAGRAHARDHLPVSSTKAGIGHLLGAAGAVEAVVCLMALRGQWLPPARRLTTPDPACQFQLVRQPVDAKMESRFPIPLALAGRTLR